MKPPFTPVAALHAQIDGKRIENVASKLGDAYTAATGDPRGSAIGRTIDGVTDDIVVDFDRGEIRSDRRTNEA